MLRLERRKTSEFLDKKHERALKDRVRSAQKIATTPPGAQRTKKIRYQWGNFRQGKTSKGTFDLLWRELCAMSFEKCAFCEVPAPSTVEHKEEVSRHPERTFDWDNLLPACGDCNRKRENSGIDARPLDPSESDPLDVLGWDEYGKFTPDPKHRPAVMAHVAMYGLDRFNEERKREISVFRELLCTLVTDTPPRQGTLDCIRVALTPTSAWRGPIREYLLRPPTTDDAWLIDEALQRVPDIRAWVKPWLRPRRVDGSRWT